MVMMSSVRTSTNEECEYKTYMTTNSGKLVALLLNALWRWFAKTGTLMNALPALKVRTKVSMVGSDNDG